MTELEIKGLIEAALRAHEIRCHEERAKMERRIDYRIDKLERHMFYAAGLAAGAVGVITFVIEKFFR